MIQQSIFPFGFGLRDICEVGEPTVPVGDRAKVEDLPKLDFPESR